MTHRRELEEHLHKLGEIRDIMNSMKTLAYMETRKLSRFLENQHLMMDSIEAMAADFVSFFRDVLPVEQGKTNIFLLIGSERGFCGNFNEALLPVMESCLNENKNKSSLLVTVGHKLHNLLEEDTRVAASLSGASVTEEIENVLTNIVDTLVELQATHPLLSLYVVYHAEKHPEYNVDIGSQILMQKLLPPFQGYMEKTPAFSNQPALNITPADFLLDLTDHYLLAALYEILYTSLMAENHRRMQHLDGAIQHMNERTGELTRKCNALRQEEIIEEIEVILLSTTNIEDEHGDKSNINSLHNLT